MKRTILFVLAVILPAVSGFSVELNELVGGSMSLLCTGQFYRNMIYWPQEAVTFQKEMLPSYGLDIGTKMQWTDKGGIAHDVKVFEVTQNGFYPVSDNNQPICESFERRLRYPLPTRIVNGIDMTVLRHTDDPVDATTPSDMVIYHHCSSDVGIDIERWAYSFVNEQYDDAIVFEFVFTNVSSEPRQDVYFGFRALPGTRLSGGGKVWSNYYGAQYRDGTDSLRIFYDCDASTYLGSHGRAPDDRAEPDGLWGNFKQPQYLGYLVLHADRSSDDETDDPAAPHKEGWADYRHIPSIEGDSHEEVYQFLSLSWDNNIQKLYTAQDGMIRLRKPGRDKRDINPQIESTKNALISFGPYHINPGDDVRIVLAFVGGSISEQLAIDAGLAYDPGSEFLNPRTPMPYAIPSLGLKAGQLLTMDQIDTLLDTGLDSLLRNAGRLVRSWDNSDIKKGTGSFAVEMVPPSPSIKIEARENDILIKWGNEAENYESDIVGYRIYRQAVDSVRDDLPTVHEWTLIHESVGSEPHEFADQDVQNGTNYFYYVTAFSQSGLQSSPFLNRTDPDHPEQAVSPGRETGDFQRVYWKEMDKYDEFDNIERRLILTWQDGVWVNQTEENYSYSYAGSDSGLQAGYLRRRWYNNAWSNSKKIVYQYNNQRQLVEKTQFRYNNSTMNWENYKKWLYEFYEDGQIKDEWRQNWRRNFETNQYEWRNAHHTIFSYNFLGNPTEKMEEQWLGNAWKESSKTIFTYNDDSLMVEDLLMHREGSDWENERRTLYEYDENKNRISYTYQVWHEAWENDRRELHAYDEQGRNTEIIHQMWNEDQWVMRYKSVYAYDFQDRIIEKWTYDWMFNTWIIKVDETTKFEIATGTSHLANGTTSMHYQILQNFPNPFNGVTIIPFMIPRSSFVTLKIYDISGRLVVSPIKNERLAAGMHRVRWNGKDRFGDTVSSGIYFCFFKAGPFKDIKHILFLK